MSDTGSSVPPFILVGFVVAAVALAAVAIWLWARTRRRVDVTVWAIVGAMAGVAVACGSLFVSGMRHYGGSTTIPGDGTRRNCGVWWDEAGLPSGQRAQTGDLSPDCHHAAIAAIGPAVLWSCVIGLAVAVVVFGAQWLAGRVRARGRDRSTMAHPDAP